MIGHAMSLARNGLAFLRWCAEEYGDLVPLHLLGKPSLFVNHPDYIAQVLATNQRKIVKGRAHRTDHALVGDGLSLREGDSWRRGRRVVQPAFHRERLAAYRPTMVRRAEQMTETWRDGEVRDLSVDLSNLALAVVAETLFGLDVSNRDSEIGQALERALECRNARARSFQLLAPASFPTPMNLRLRLGRWQVNRALDRSIAERRTSGDDVGDLLSLLLQSTDEDGRRLTDHQVRSEILTVFLGGAETVANLLAWVWYLLSQHPDVEARLVDELDSVIGGCPPAAADLPLLPYAGMIVSEALRLYPPATVLEREAIAEFEIDGHRVRRGTEILISPWVMHRDRRFFDEPDRFDPNRWADGLASRLPAYAYFPFGGGPRRCIGRAFATLEAIMVLATVVPRFRLELEAGQPVVADPIPTLHPKFGLRMAVRARRSRGVARATAKGAAAR